MPALTGFCQETFFNTTMTFRHHHWHISHSSSILKTFCWPAAVWLNLILTLQTSDNTAVAESVLQTFSFRCCQIRATAKNIQKQQAPRHLNVYVQPWETAADAMLGA